jgi:hypothetical protein
MSKANPPWGDGRYGYRRITAMLWREGWHVNGAGTVILSRNGAKRIGGCTFVGNAGVRASGIYVAGPDVEVSNCILAFGKWGWPIARNPADERGVLTCCDVFGNEAGDWVGCLTAQAGINGNFSLDPLFCDPEAGDLHLQWESPCLPEHSNGCGLIGAWGAGDCNGISVASESWGRIKAMFRSGVTTRSGAPDAASR